MSGPPVPLHEQKEETQSGMPRGENLRLLVFSGETLTTHALPHRAQLVIGRADECQIQIDLPVLSRRHALIRVGPPLTIEDLGSANGTWLRGEKLVPGKPTLIQAGDA